MFAKEVNVLQLAKHNLRYFSSHLIFVGANVMENLSKMGKGQFYSRAPCGLLVSRPGYAPETFIHYLLL